MKFSCNADSFYKHWDAVHYETICILIVDDDTQPEDILEPILKALCACGFLKEGDQFKAAKAGNTIIIGKAHLYIDMDSCDSLN